MTYLRRVTGVFVLCFILLALANTSSFASAGDLRLVDSEVLGEGTYLHHYEMSVDDDTLLVRKLEVDLNNQHVEVGALSPEGGFNDRQTVRAMAQREDAVAAVNADYFHLTGPTSAFGLHMEDGEMLSSPSDNTSWLGFGIDDEKTPHIMNWLFKGEVILDGSQSFELAGYNQNFRGEGMYLYDRNWGAELPGEMFDGPVAKAVIQDGEVVQLQRGERSIQIPRGSSVLVAKGIDEAFLLRHARHGTPVEFAFDLDPDMDLETAVGGHVLLVDDGRLVSTDRLGSSVYSRASRTAVGIDSSAQEMFFVTVDGTSSRAGINMIELANLMRDLGAERALNLDGGGSTTMVARRLGSFDLDLVNSPRTGFQRSVVNAVGIFNRAPEGDAEKLFISGPDGLLIGTEAEYQVSGHDEHYHPLDISPRDLNWNVSEPEMADIDDTGTITATGSGRLHLRVAYEGAVERMMVNVFGSDDIEAFKVNPEHIQLLPKQSVTLDSVVEIDTGLMLEPGPKTVDWQSEIGSVSQGVFTASETEGQGMLTADIDGITMAEIPVSVGGKEAPLICFDEKEDLTFRGHPEDLTGSFEIETDSEYVYSGEQAARLDYDFSRDIEGIMIAYGQIGDGDISLGDDSLAITSQIRGDASGYWLRAEIYDASGGRRYVDLAESIDWEGYQSVSARIDPDWPRPLKLSSIYLVAEPEDKEADAPESGSIHIDDLKVIRGLEHDEFADSDAFDVKMWVGRKEYEVPGRRGEMDTAPFIEEGRTFVPVRFLGEAFDAEVDWTPDPETGRAQKVTLEDEDKLIILEIGEPYLEVVDKNDDEVERYEVDVAPRVIDGRTYLPFRAIGEYGFDAIVDFSTHPDSNRVDSVWFVRW